MKIRSRFVVFAAAAAVTLAVHVVLAVDVKVDVEKSFDFKTVRTWGWNPEGAGHLRMARTPDDDPEVMKKRVDPVIMDAVTSAMSERGLQFVSTAPDLLVTYYLLLTMGSSAQTIGQFVPGSDIWSIPPFIASTQSLEVMNQGSLVLDLSANGKIVWRGLAEAQIRMGTDAKRREALLREAVRDLLRRYPKRS